MATASMEDIPLLKSVAKESCWIAWMLEYILKRFGRDRICFLSISCTVPLYIYFLKRLNDPIHYTKPINFRSWSFFVLVEEEEIEKDCRFSYANS
jgi:hypothetical protein